VSPFFIRDNHRVRRLVDAHGISRALCVLAIVAAQANAQQAALGLEAVLSAAGANRAEIAAARARAEAIAEVRL
jgi:hypothetical protein